MTGDEPLPPLETGGKLLPWDDDDEEPFEEDE